MKLTIEQKQLAVVTAIIKSLTDSFKKSDASLPEGGDFSVDFEINASIGNDRFHDACKARITKGFGYSYDIEEQINSNYLLMLMLQDDPSLVGRLAKYAKVFDKLGNKGLEAKVKEPSPIVSEVLTRSRNTNSKRSVTGAIRLIESSSSQIGDHPVSEPIKSRSRSKSKSK